MKKINENSRFPTLTDDKIGKIYYAYGVPAKHTIREYAPDNYYHVFNRGVAKQRIFLDQADKRYFLQLFDRHLNQNTKQLNKNGLPYKSFHPHLELMAYCLMSNHFHMLFYLGDDITGLSECMKSISTSYAMYFNLKYKRVGPVFQGVFKASRITSDKYLLHISRYIHLNPRHFQTYKFSSYAAYLGEKPPPWLAPKRMLAHFDGVDYAAFTEDYIDHKKMLDIIEYELANT